MGRLILRKLGHVVVVLLIVSFVLAFLLDLAPGDPAYSILGDDATPEQVQQVHEDLNLDAPFYERYSDWLGNVVTGDFGTSYRNHEKVTDRIVEALPVTVEMIVLALVMALLISIPAGVYSAYKADGRFDRLCQLVTSVLISVPPFVSALILVFIFSLRLGHFPATGWVKLQDDPLGNLQHAFLPALTLALAEVPAYTRLLRADMVATLQEDFILAARAKGLPTRKVLLGHALRPSSFSLITLAALSAGRLLGGSVIVETVFALPGLGQLLIFHILSKDVLVVQGIVMFMAVMYVLINSLTDIGYSYLDPRVRADGV